MKILFVTYSFISTVSCRCRSYLPAKGLQNQNTQARVKLIYLMTRADIDWADVVIFQRIPQAVWYFKKLHLPISLIINRIQNLFDYSISKKQTGIDMDDHIFLKGSGIETGVPDNFLPGLLRKSHFVIASTDPLALELSSYNSNVSVVKNALDFGLYENPRIKSYTSEIVRMVKLWKEQGLFVLGWTAGKTHGHDFEIFSKIIEQLDDSLLNRIKIILIGSQNQGAAAFDNLVFQTRFLPWHQPQFILKELDANLVILQDNLLNQCKSELKLIEAGYFGVPSICSPVGVFGDLVYKNEIGLLASDPKEWVEQIKHFVRQDDLRKKLGENVRKFVFENYDLKKRGKEYLDLFSKLGR